MIFAFKRWLEADALFRCRRALLSVYVIMYVSCTVIAGRYSATVNTTQQV